MPPEETAVQAPAPVAAPVDASAARAAKEKASADKWASEAVKAMEAKEGGKAEPVEAEKPAEKPRAKDGKFVADKAKAKEKSDGEKTEAKAKAEAVPGKDGAPNGRMAKPAAEAGAEANEKPAEGGAKDEPAHEFSGGLGKAKRLVREGKIADALKLIDCDPERIPGGQWAAWRKENRRKESELVEAYKEVERQREAVKSEARELVAQLRPFAEAKQALDAGDDDKVLEIIFGKTVDAWQRERLGKMHRGDLSKDPAVAEAKRLANESKAEAERLRKELEERDRKAAEREQRAEAERAQAAYREDLKGRLAESGDPRLERAAELPWFVKMVHQARLDSYKFNPHTGQEDCLSEDEAIEQVYDPERLTAAQWQQLTGELDSSAKRDHGAKNHADTDRRGTDVKRALRAPTSLSRSATVEAAPERRRSPADAAKHWGSIGQRLANEGKFGR